MLLEKQIIVTIIIIDYIIKFNILFKDYDKLLKKKWIPKRKKWKYKWLFKKLAKNMYSNVVYVFRNKWISAEKCYTNYRKLFFILNRYANCAHQIKMAKN